MNDLTHAAQFQSDVRLVRSFAKYGTPMEHIVAALRDSGRSEHHVTSVLATAAQPEDLDAPAAAPAVEQMSVWTLTIIEPLYNVQEGDYHEMQVVAQSPEAARQWAYRRAVLDNKPNPRVWLDADEFLLRVSHFDSVKPDAMSGVLCSEVWTVEKMGAAPLR